MGKHRDTMTMGEVAALCHVTKRTVRTWRKEKAGFPAPMRVGRRPLWFRQQVMEWLKQQREATPEPLPPEAP